MTPEVRFENIREKLRSLFLDELLVDEGWSAYINLLLGNISYDNFLLLRTNGFPAAFNFPKQVFTYGDEGVTGYLEDCFTVVEGDDNTIGFRYDGTSGSMLDFSTIDVIPINIERVTITNPVTGETINWVAGYGPNFITFDSSLITTFYVARDRVLTPVKTPIPGLEFAADNLSGHGGKEVDGQWYYNWDQAMAAAEALGDGWRLPTAAEFRKLAAAGSTWDDERKGCWFGGNHATDHEGSLFLPAMGSVDIATGTAFVVGTLGGYWSSSRSSDTPTHAGNLLFTDKIKPVVQFDNGRIGDSVRLVRDIQNGEKFVPDPDFDLLPCRISEDLDPVAINEAIYNKNAYYQPLEPPTSPQALFGLIARLLRGKNINIWYEFAEGSGTQRQSYSNYVKFHSLTVTKLNAGNNSYVTAWTDSPVPIDPLRDTFGYGINLSPIIGYDKQYLVAANNAPKERITPLIADDSSYLGTGSINATLMDGNFTSRGGERTVQVSTVPAADFDIMPLFIPTGELPDPFVLVAEDENGELIYLADPSSIQEQPILGITKFYSMLSIRKGGMLKKIHLEAKVIAADLVGKEAALEEALSNAAKPGVIGDMAFYYPSVADNITIRDEYEPSFYIDSSVSEMEFGQRGGTILTQITIRPLGHEFNVK